MRVNVYSILQECVETGVERGYNRAHKHTDAPGILVIRNTIEEAVLESICEYFFFED